MIISKLIIQQSAGKGETDSFQGAAFKRRWHLNHNQQEKKDFSQPASQMTGSILNDSNSCHLEYYVLLNFIPCLSLKRFPLKVQHTRGLALGQFKCFHMASPGAGPGTRRGAWICPAFSPKLLAPNTIVLSVNRDTPSWSPELLRRAGLQPDTL